MTSGCLSPCSILLITWVLLLALTSNVIGDRSSRLQRMPVFYGKRNKHYDVKIDLNRLDRKGGLPSRISFSSNNKNTNNDKNSELSSSWPLPPKTNQLNELPSELYNSKQMFPATIADERRQYNDIDASTRIIPPFKEDDRQSAGIDSLNSNRPFGIGDQRTDEDSSIGLNSQAKDNGVNDNDDDKDKEYYKGDNGDYRSRLVAQLLAGYKNNVVNDNYYKNNDKNDGDDTYHNFLKGRENNNDQKTSAISDTPENNIPSNQVNTNHYPRGVIPLDQMSQAKEDIDFIKFLNNHTKLLSARTSNPHKHPLLTAARSSYSPLPRVYRLLNIGDALNRRQGHEYQTSKEDDDITTENLQKNSRFRDNTSRNDHYKAEMLKKRSRLREGVVGVPTNSAEARKNTPHYDFERLHSLFTHLRFLLLQASQRKLINDQRMINDRYPRHVGWMRKKGIRVHATDSLWKKRQFRSSLERMPHFYGKRSVERLNGEDEHWLDKIKA